MLIHLFGSCTHQRSFMDNHRFSIAAQKLNNLRPNISGRSVVYRRSGEDDLNITAAKTIVEDDTEIQSATQVRLELADWIISVSELSSFGKPQKGDLIVEGSDQWQVANELGSPYRDHDSAGLSYRIQTKRVV